MFWMEIAADNDDDAAAAAAMTKHVSTEPKWKEK